MSGTVAGKRQLWPEYVREKNMNEKTKLSVAAKFAKWSIRQTPGNSIRVIKIASALSLLIGIIYMVWAFYNKTIETFLFGFLWMSVALIHFMKAGFYELIENGYTQQKGSNQSAHTTA